MVNELNTGKMPNTDYTYQDFSEMLRDFLYSLQSLKDGSEVDMGDWELISAIFDALARNHDVSCPTQMIKDMSEGGEVEGPPGDSSHAIMDYFHSFKVDFGIGMERGTRDCLLLKVLWQIVAEMLLRHKMLGSIKRDSGGLISSIQPDIFQQQRSFLSLRQMIKDDLIS
jgi:hypothetical protein